MQNIQRKLKMDFPHYKCFFAITNLIVGLHTLYATRSRANVVVVVKDRHFDTYYSESFHVRDIKRMCIKT